MYSKWNVLNSMWAVSLWVECSLFSARYVEVTAQLVESVIVVSMVVLQ